MSKHEHKVGDVAVIVAEKAERIDKRQAKHYAAVVRVVGQCFFATADAALCARNTFGDVAEALCSTLGTNSVVVRRGYARVTAMVVVSDDSTCPAATLSVTFSFVKRAARPKEISTARQVFGAVGGELAVRAAIEAGMREALATHTENARLARDKQTANHLVGTFREEVCAKAKKACRYAQRLAALKAELESEKQVQAAAMVAEVGAEPLTCDTGEPIADSVRDAALKALPAGVKGEPGRMMMPISLKEYVTDDDVRQ